MAQFREIPLNKLKLSPDNMRQGEVDFSDLEASFRARKVILQNLRVTAETNDAGKPTGFFLVHVGGRRLRMLDKLAGEKFIGKTWPVPCAICEDASEAFMESMEENFQRLPPTDAERFRAFKKLADDGLTVEQIAERFATSPLIVRRRLAYANVSPKLFELFERDEIRLDQMQVLCLTDDHATQEAAFFGVPENMRQAWQIRDRLVKGRHATNHWMMSFVGRDAFQAAGGVVEVDLFSDKDGEGYFSDMALLEKLALAKLEEQAEAVRAEGWAWVEVQLQYNYSQWEKYGRVYPSPVGLSGDAKAELDKLEAELEQLHKEAECAGPDDEAIYEEIAELEGSIGELKTAGGEAYAPEDLALAGCVVCISGHNLRIERGYVRPGADLKALKARAAAAEKKGELVTTASVPTASGKRADGLSQATVEQLTAHRTVALRASLLTRPDVALVAMTHRLLTLAFYRTTYGYDSNHSVDTALTLNADGRDRLDFTPELAATAAGAAIVAQREAIRSQLPENTVDLWAFLQGLAAEKLNELFAFGVAMQVYAVQPAGYSATRTRMENANQIARAVELDMADFWSPDAAFLGGLPKEGLIEALKDGAAADPASLGNLKKGELAGRALTELEGKRWLPDILKTPPAGEPGQDKATLAAAPKVVVTGADNADDEDGDNEDLAA